MNGEAGKGSKWRKGINYKKYYANMEDIILKPDKENTNIIKKIKGNKTTYIYKK